MRNIRYKRKAYFDKDHVASVENVLKDMIEYGFSEHVDEELLVFDDDGNLVRVDDGKSLAPDQRGDQFKVRENRDGLSSLPQGLQKLMKSSGRQEAAHDEDDDIIKDGDDYGSISSSNIDDAASSVCGGALTTRSANQGTTSKSLKNSSHADQCNNSEQAASQFINEFKQKAILHSNVTLDNTEGKDLGNKKNQNEIVTSIQIPMPQHPQYSDSQREASSSQYNP